MGKVRCTHTLLLPFVGRKVVPYGHSARKKGEEFEAWYNENMTGKQDTIKMKQ